MTRFLAGSYPHGGNPGKILTGRGIWAFLSEYDLPPARSRRAFGTAMTPDFTGAWVLERAVSAGGRGRDALARGPARRRGRRGVRRGWPAPMLPGAAGAWWWWRVRPSARR